MFKTKLTTVPITKRMVMEGYLKVKKNHGSAGVDNEGIEAFEADLLNNLYKLWNRLSSGSYFPKPVMEVIIPKSNGGKRKLGIPTVSDRIAQEVIKAYLEPRLEAEFHSNSFGYRPGKSAHHAIEQVRKNVRGYKWAIDMDIKNFFDEVNHELLMKALSKHVNETWVMMYIMRWLEAPIRTADGKLLFKDGKGTPQGGVISPLLSNLYLHYVLDKWLERKHPEVTFVRYADDIIIHCHNEYQSEHILSEVGQRLAECKLELSENKTKIVQCLDYTRKKHKNYSKKFDFLGFTFKPRTTTSRLNGGLFLGFDCAISQKSITRIVEGWNKSKFHRQNTLCIQDIALRLNPQIVGICRYYGKYKLWNLRKLFRRLHNKLATWALTKYKSFNRSRRKALEWIEKIKSQYPNMFYHWGLFKTV